MIAFPAGTKVWIAGGVTDMRRGIGPVFCRRRPLAPDIILDDVERRSAAAGGKITRRPQTLRAQSPDVRAVAQQEPRAYPFQRVDESRERHCRRVFDQEVDMVRLAVAFDEAGIEVSSHLGETLAQPRDRIGVEMTAPISGHKDQMHM